MRTGRPSRARSTSASSHHDGSRAATIARLLLLVGVSACTATKPSVNEARSSELAARVGVYRELWARLAAEANEMPVVAFLGLVRADAPILECHPARGTCTFRITYRYSRSWMEMTETDLLYVRMEAGPWLGERELRADLAKRGTGDHLSSMIRGLEDPLAFSSRADAEAAFVAAFGHPPSRAVVWQRPHPYPVLPATPLLEGRTEACVKEVLSLVTGRAAKVREDICFEESSP